MTLGPGRRIAVPQPTFTLYKLMATALQADVHDVLLDAEDLTFDVDASDRSGSALPMLLSFATPNNPTGTSP